MNNRSTEKYARDNKTKQNSNSNSGSGSSSSTQKMTLVFPSVEIEKNSRIVATMCTFHLSIPVCCVLSNFAICCLPVCHCYYYCSAGIVIPIHFVPFHFFFLFQFICRSEHVAQFASIAIGNHGTCASFWSVCLLCHRQTGPNDNSSGSKNSSSHLHAIVSLKITLGFRHNLPRYSLPLFSLHSACYPSIHRWIAKNDENRNDGLGRQVNFNWILPFRTNEIQEKSLPLLLRVQMENEPKLPYTYSYLMGLNC